MVLWVSSISGCGLCASCLARVASLGVQSIYKSLPFSEGAQPGRVAPAIRPEARVIAGHNTTRYPGVVQFRSRHPAIIDDPHAVISRRPWKLLWHASEGTSSGKGAPGHGKRKAEPFERRMRGDTRQIICFLVKSESTHCVISNTCWGLCSTNVYSSSSIP